MLDQIFLTDHPPQFDEGIEPKQPLLIELNLRASDKAALVSCVEESLKAIEKANRTFDAETRDIAIIEYNDNLKRALSAGIPRKHISNQCRNVHYQCLAANLLGIVLASVTGAYYKRIDDIIAWYEDDRHRMIAAGFHASAIDSRMTKIKLKLVKK